MINSLSALQVNQKDYMNDGVTPLTIAVKNKHADAVRQLVKHPEVDLDPLDNDGHSLEFHVRRYHPSAYRGCSRETRT